MFKSHPCKCSSLVGGGFFLDSLTPPRGLFTPPHRDRDGKRWIDIEDTIPTTWTRDGTRTVTSKSQNIADEGDQQEWVIGSLIIWSLSPNQPSKSGASTKQ